MVTLNPNAVAQILCELLNRSYNELNGEFYIALTQDEQNTIIVSETSDFVVIKNFIPGISKDYLEYLSKVIKDYPEVQGKILDGKPAIIVDKKADLERVRGALRKVYEAFAYDMPNEALNLFGGFIVSFLGQKYSIVASRDRAKGMFSDNYVTLPDDSGWMFSYLGIDNINIPILSWKSNGSLLAYVPDADGSLRIFNVSKFVEKLRDLFSKAGVGLKIRDEAELFRFLSEIEENIEIIKTTLRGKTIPFISSTKTEEISELESLLEEVKSGLEQIRKTVTLSRLVEQRMMVRRAVQLAKRILRGEEGVLSIATRKVSRLGAGYAVYISKEEAKTLRLAGKVTVKVVVEEGQKPKIMIQ